MLCGTLWYFLHFLTYCYFMLFFPFFGIGLLWGRAQNCFTVRELELQILKETLQPSLILK